MRTGCSSSRPRPKARGACWIFRRKTLRCSRRIVREPVGSSGHIFVDSEGNPIRKSNFHRRICKPLIERAELPGLDFHHMRHTCTSHLLASGIPPHVVAERLGHANVTTLLTVYAHVLPRQGKVAADAMAAILER